MTPEEMHQRILICEDCKEYKTIEILNRTFIGCGLCGCILDVKIKAPDATCPSDKWPKLNP